jgi:hypothetical protein
MTQRLRHYLLVFDHIRGQLIDEREFDNAPAALAAYSAAERKYDSESRIEVVLIGSDSRDTVRRTHANYFDGSVALERYLTGA